MAKAKAKKKIMVDRLPNTLSGLIDVAVADVKAVSKLKGYKLDMGTWHQPNGHCTVCFAGSVMAQTLKVPKNDVREPENFPPAVRDKLFALNALREGNVGDAAEYLRTHDLLDELQETVAGSFDRSIDASDFDADSYDKSRLKDFLADMTKLSSDLKRFSL